MQDSNHSPKNFFLQIGIFGSLYASVISLLVFLFSVIDSAFPDSLSYVDISSESIRFSLSVLIVVFPLFVWLSAIYRKFTVAVPSIKESRSRKWIIYFTLFVTGATLAGDLIFLINTFLGGEVITTSFLLKALAVFLVTGGVFLYGIKDVKGYFEDNISRSRLWLGITTGIIIIVVITGFVIIGSPMEQRRLVQDGRRIDDLYSIQWQIVNHYQDTGKLPVNLDVFNDALANRTVPVDPETRAEYEYKVTGPLTFNLCATFTEPTKPGKTNVNYVGDWKHDAGHVCFERTIDPVKYPVYKERY